MTIRLTRIYTKRGDHGLTDLGGGGRVPKDHPRIQVCGALDEANASLALARQALKDQTNLAQRLKALQNTLFDAGADFCLPVKAPDKPRLRLSRRDVLKLEKEIDEINARLKPLSSFIIPEGPPAWIHLARAQIRRAERSAARLLIDEKEAVNPHAVIWLNRLSDLLFTLARAAAEGETLWKPKEKI